jgi:hypothetical protein
MARARQGCCLDGPARHHAHLGETLMTIETLLAIVALVLVAGVIGFMVANTWKGRAVVRQRLPFETMLDAVKEELLRADQKAREQGSALMRFKNRLCCLVRYDLIK